MVNLQTPSARKLKSRLGCQTCKSRKIKCDEQKPCCQRCVHSGRVCSYTTAYQDLETARRSTSNGLTPQPSRTSSLISGGTTETEYFTWYLVKSSVKLPGAFYSPSMTSLLYQGCTIEPAVNHAVLCLGAVHKTLAQEGSSNSIELVVAREYCSTISSLKPYLDDTNRHSIRITLVVCLLLTQMEYLRGCSAKGMFHLKHGLRLLISLEPSSASYELDGWLIASFVGLLIQAKLSHQLQDFSCLHLISLLYEDRPSQFRSIHHAKRLLNCTLLRIFEIREFGSQNLQKDLEDINLDLEHWLQIWNSVQLQSLDWQQYVAYHILRTFHSLATVLAHTAQNARDVMSWDSQLSLFVAIVKDCLTMYHKLHPIDGPQANDHHHDRSGGDSISDIGWIAPLHFTAVHCRNPYLRRQATAMLKFVPHGEGIFDSMQSVAVATELMQLEEDGFYDDVQVLRPLRYPCGEDLKHPILPENARIINLSLAYPRDQLLRMSYARNGIRRYREYDQDAESWREFR